MVIEELTYYQPDLMCLQGKRAGSFRSSSQLTRCRLPSLEMDNYDEFYKDELAKLG